MSHTCKAIVVTIAVAVTGLPALALAQPPVDDGADGLPGSHRVGFPVDIPGLAVITASAGYGGRDDVLEAGDTHRRTTATLSGNWRPRPWLAIGLRVDGRYDAHTGMASADDDSFVGDPRLFVRVRRGVGASAAIGVHAGLWFPSESLLAVDGLSPELRALASYRITSALAVAANAGFRFDRSAGTVPAPDLLSRADRMSLGVSDADAVLLGAAVSWRRGRLSVTADWSWDLLVGSGAPDRDTSPMRVGAEARWRLGARSWLRVGAEAGLSAAPPVDIGEPLVPVEPRLSAWLGFTYRFDQSPRPAGAAPPVEPVATAIEGVVVDLAGAPIADAQLRAGQQVATSDLDGRFRIDGVAPGATTVSAAAAGFRTESVELSLQAPATPVRIILSPDLPPGQIRGLVRTLAGQPISDATVRVDPLGIEIASGADGSFRLDVPPGEYSLVLTAGGYQSQTRRLRVDQNGVTVINVELREAER